MEHTDRLRQLTKLTPRRFHISSNPPFGIGLLIFGHENQDYDDEDELREFFDKNEGIRNCKPGIWTSLTRKIPAEPDQSDTEHILRWVCPGSIDISQSISDWTAYEDSTRQLDADVKISKIVPKGTKWRRYGSYYDDGGVCTIVSSEYLTHEAARAIMFGDTDKESEEEMSFGFYLETVSLNGVGMSVRDPPRVTIGGMNFYQDEVGGPPRIAVAEEEGLVIAVRFFQGEEDWASEGTEEGLESEEEDEEEGETEG